MGDFAIVAEGRTDQMVIKNVLLGIFADANDEPLVVFEQPLDDETGKAGTPSPGGWSQVIRYLREGKYREALQTNGYLVVHIDSDVSEDYGVAKPDGHDPQAMSEAVVAKLRELIDGDVLEAYGERIIFAVAVHSIECWLLPLLFPNKTAKRAKIMGCLDAADNELGKRSEPRLKRGVDGKDPEGYRAASLPYTKRKTLELHRDHNPSLGAFVRDVERRAIQIPTDNG